MFDVLKKAERKKKMTAKRVARPAADMFSYLNNSLSHGKKGELLCPDAGLHTDFSPVMAKYGDIINSPAQSETCPCF